ncbi:MAG: adenylyltransferase/cytidyltransferase family protein [Patescibacteria group bacterium]
MRNATKTIYHKVLVFGIFDLLHPGHKYFLRQAKKYGDQLIVVVARDKVAAELKKIPPVQFEKIRLEQIKKLKEVSFCCLGSKRINHNYELVKKLNPDLICVGYDQIKSLTNLKKKMRRLGLNKPIVRLGAFFPRRFKSRIYRLKLKY